MNKMLEKFLEDNQKAVDTFKENLQIEKEKESKTEEALKC